MDSAVNLAAAKGAARLKQNLDGGQTKKRKPVAQGYALGFGARGLTNINTGSQDLVMASIDGRIAGGLENIKEEVYQTGKSAQNQGINPAMLMRDGNLPSDAVMSPSS